MPTSTESEHFRRELRGRHLPLASLTSFAVKETDRVSNLPTTEERIVRETELGSSALSAELNPLLILPVPLSHHYQLKLGS